VLGNVNLEDYEKKTLFSLIDMEKDGFMKLGQTI